MIQTITVNKYENFKTTVIKSPKNDFKISGKNIQISGKKCRKVSKNFCKVLAEWIEQDQYIKRNESHKFNYGRYIWLTNVLNNTFGFDVEDL